MATLNGVWSLYLQLQREHHLPHQIIPRLQQIDRSKLGLDVDRKCWSCSLARDTSRSFAEIARVGACLLGGGRTSRSLLAGGHVCRNLLAGESGRPAGREAAIDGRSPLASGSRQVEGRWVQNSNC
uniref:Uncharacterized protein n=1 Tax=Setaria viridis TaxID=4556 RepID=A0A4U6UNE2_SETVI|nr:hypothetical protein SEVIR_5G263300v2 [Setaria viridis]